MDGGGGGGEIVRLAAGYTAMHYVSPPNVATERLNSW
jgi:hypothetical protein